VLLHIQMHSNRQKERIFKTTWFSKAARKAHITDDDLCSAMAEVMLGQADDLGGGVFKKRLGKNMYRSIILAMGSKHWVYEYLFAKRIATTSKMTNSSPFASSRKPMRLLRSSSSPSCWQTDI
jgi:hypothetical protein